MKAAGAIGIKEINRLALPAIAAGIAEPIIALVDTAFIGHIGTAALGGIGIGSSLFVLFVWMLTQTKTAISAIVSQHYGAGTLESVRSLIPQTLLTVFLIGLAVFGLTDFFSEPLLRLYSAKGAVLSEADRYFSIRCIGYPAVLVTFTIFGIFRGVQNTAWAMIISITGALVNLLLDILLINGYGDLVPAMGIEGAAWASVTAQVVMLSMSLAFLLVNTPFSLKLEKVVHPDFYKLLGLSGGFIIRVMALNVTFFLANRYATGYGEEYIAAHTIAVNIWLFSSYFIDGYANAGNALAGRLIGEKDERSLYQVAMRLLRISVFIGGLLALVYLLLYPFMGGFFSDDEVVIGLFNSIFWIVLLAQPVNAVAFSFDGIFKGLGRARYLMSTLLIASFVGFVPLLLIGDALDWRLYGIWAGFTLFMAIRGGTLWWKLKREFGRAKRFSEHS